MNRRIRCECGAVVLPSYYIKHRLTKKHLENLEYETDDEPVSKTFYEKDGLKITEKVSFIGDRDKVGKVDAQRDSCCVIF